MHSRYQNSSRGSPVSKIGATITAWKTGGHRKHSRRKDLEPTSIRVVPYKSTNIQRADPSNLGHPQSTSSKQFRLPKRAFMINKSETRIEVHRKHPVAGQGLPLQSHCLNAPSLTPLPTTSHCPTPPHNRPSPDYSPNCLTVSASAAFSSSPSSPHLPSPFLLSALPPLPLLE